MYTYYILKYSLSYKYIFACINIMCLCSRTVYRVKTQFAIVIKNYSRNQTSGHQKVTQIRNNIYVMTSTNRMQQWTCAQSK